MPFADPMKRRQYAREWARRDYKKNPERRKAAAKKHVLKYPERKRARTRKWYKQYYRKWKALVFNAYGNVCACCGESNPQFLTVDHVNRDGKSHRRQRSGSYGVLQDVVKRGYPKEFRLLCMNCNWGTRMGNTCPHQQKMADATFNIRAVSTAIPFYPVYPISAQGYPLHAS